MSSEISSTMSSDLLSTIMSSDISSTIQKSWRGCPPSSYSLKVQIFSQFQNSTLESDGKYESHTFTSGDYKWKMIMYPKGNDKDEGSGFISMYVEIDTTSLISKTPPVVFADLRFFVFNKKENKYFTIQDVESKMFSTLRTIWGLSQVLPLETFNDPKNGYIFDGEHCEFGVDIILTPTPTKLEMLSFVKPLNPKFSWSVNKFSDINENLLVSDTFAMGQRQWVLKLFPNGVSTTYIQWLSIYLFLAGDQIIKDDEKIYMAAHLIVQDPLGSNQLKRTFSWWCHGCTTSSHGYAEFVSIEELRKSNLDKEDTLKVEIEFEIISATQYSSSIV